MHAVQRSYTRWRQRLWAPSKNKTFQHSFPMSSWYQIMNFQCIHTYALCYSMQGVQLRHGRHTHKKNVNLWKLQYAQPICNLHSQLATVVPFVKANMWDCAYWQPREAVLMPSQRKQICDTDDCSCVSLPAAHLRFQISMFFILNEKWLLTSCQRLTWENTQAPVGTA